MGLLFLGIIALLATMFVVMGSPLIYYLKRDQKWNTSNDKSLTLWYN